VPRISITTTTQVTSTVTGALVVKGGVGIGGGIFAGSTATIEINNALAYPSYANGLFVKNVGSNTVSARLQNTQGTVDTVAQAGTYTVVSTVGANPAQVILSGNGSNLNIPSTVNATSTVTGALTVAGGAGIGRDLYVGGELYVSGLPISAIAPAGPTGYTGSPGVSGYNGSQGPSGPSGPQGYTGSRGVSGYNGSQGYTGSMGQGITVQGQVANSSALGGVVGPAPGDGYITQDDGHLWVYTGFGPVSGFFDAGQFIGYTGSVGFTGSRGASGPQGPQGYTGSFGTDGPIGYTGSASTQAGYTGSQGSIGPTGFDGSGGTTGFTGSTGSGFVGSKGDEGPTGFTGSTGYIGSAGTSITLKGAVLNEVNLPAGGNTAGDAYVVTSTGHIWIWSGSSWQDGGTFIGYVGSQGPSGPSGPQGYTGSIGATGPSGLSGSVGTSGPSGPSGPQGLQGYAGSGVGPTGPSGPRGPQGPTSTTPGPSGPSGPPSTLSGPQGPQGPSGPSGPSGSAGTPSTVPGPSGPTGPSGQGLPGNLGPQGPQGYWGSRGYTGSSGPQGGQGNIGPSGPSGPSGPRGDQGVTGPGLGFDLSAVPQSILPSLDVTYDLGSITKQWRSLYLSGSTMYLGGKAVSITEEGGLLIGGNPISSITSGTYSITILPTGNIKWPNTNQTNWPANSAGFLKNNGIGTLTWDASIPTANLSGTISNAQLANSGITVNGTAISLGNSGTLSNGSVTNEQLANSKITINGTEVSLGGMISVSSGGGTPGGSSGQIQFNSSGAFGGNSTFKTDGAGYVSIVHDVPKLEWHRPGQRAGILYIRSSDNMLVLSETGGNGIAAGDRIAFDLTNGNIFTNGGISVGGGFSGGSSGVYTTGNMRINNTAPTITLQDTDNVSAFIHVNDNQFYILRSTNSNEQSWPGSAIPNGRWPMTLNLLSGDVTFSGNVTAYSDSRLKKNISTLENSLNVVNQLRGISYQRIETEEKNIGLVAQEVEQVLPEVVIKDKDGYLSISYSNIVAVLIEAIKELNAKVEELKKKLP
jgi:hypothetical protein